jgi:pimeloyl-ACP methyl ester carboxylesterase
MPGAYGPSGHSAWLDIDWRAHQRAVTVEDRLVNIVELGSGPPLLFVHGLGGCWQNWLENLPHFARDHRVIAVDLPGFGASQMPAAAISVGGYARTLDRLCDALALDAAAVVGNSMGGFVAAELAIAHPQRVERLVLVSAAGLQIAELRLGRALGALALTRVDRVVGLYGGWVAAHSETVARRMRLRRLMFAGIARHPEVVPWPIVAEQAQGFGRPGFLPALRAMASYRCATGSARSPARRSSSGARTTGSCHSATPTPSSGSSATRARSSTATPGTCRCSSARRGSTPTCGRSWRSRRGRASERVHAAT